ncbi:hypothetical protein E0L36_15720 [Streptomyces sp. AJS327]|uniref:SAM-dependent methyltransferase n=1 Tax=Streptomyces sp. AJS327 TaxID=2545265 RepID=UPI0015DEE6A4|nr:SAM-dependent methyltransferase [Streptomyces sp. AJS327]MBA0052303.1 hypothetical protein [Streptomyces sp. AJS327]
MERPAWAPQGMDLNVPSVSRMYDHYLGGSHNFEVDREAARRAVRAWPGLPRLVQANRAFVRRAVRYAVRQGVTQFLDVGSGLPTFGSVPETALGLDPDCRVLCVDNDQVAVAHSRAVLADEPHAGIVSADLRTPRDILDSEQAEQLLDFGRPTALLLTAVLHFVADRDEPAKAVSTLGEALAPGSLLIISHASTQPGARHDCAPLLEVYGTTNAPLTLRSRAEIGGFLDGFELVEPGLTTPPHWRPDDDPPQGADPAALSVCAGVGRKAGDPG